MSYPDHYKFNKDKLSKVVKDAKEKGLKVIKGLDMFTEQAKESFSLWFGKKPEVDKKILGLLNKEINRK